MLCTTFLGSWYQSWYSSSIQLGVTAFSGWQPWYHPVHNFHGTDPSLMLSIWAWRSWWSVIGGTSLWGMRVADQMLRRWSTSRCDSSAFLKRRSASSNPAQELKGDQSSSDFSGGGMGGIPGERNTPSLSHRHANRSKGLVRKHDKQLSYWLMTDGSVVQHQITVPQAKNSIGAQQQCAVSGHQVICRS